MISLVSRRGASMKSPFFRIKFLPARYGDTKIAIITSKKVEKKAVRRNCIRRRVSACFENTLFAEIDEKNERKFLLVVFPTAEVLKPEYTYELLEKSVREVLGKMKIFTFQKRKSQSQYFSRKKKGK